MKSCFSILVLIFYCCSLTTVKSQSKAKKEIKSLKSIASIPLGAAVSNELLKSNASYREVVTKHYSRITAENAMKWHRVHPAQDTYSFDDADYIVNYANENGKQVFGHVLVWHSLHKLDWVKNFQGDSATWEHLMRDHIRTVVTHFKGQLVGWDVVNEAFHDDGTLRIEGEEGSLWAKHLGKDYIARAFQYAHEADPNALLFYNDYGHEYSKAKLNAIIALIEDLKKRGIPIHGVGLQMHTHVNRTNDDIRDALKRMASLGLLVHISELDINFTRMQKKPDLTLTNEMLQQQKAKYKFIVDTYYETVPKPQRFGITTWNVGDKDSWIRWLVQENEWPLLFDEEYKPKPAFYGFLEGLKNNVNK